MLKGILKIFVIIGLVFGATYLVPEEFKKGAVEKMKALIADATPEAVKEHLEPIIFTPTERRAKLLAQLEENIKVIKQELEAPQTEDASTGSNAETPTQGENFEQKQNQPQNAITKKIEQVEKIIEEIVELNDEQGVINKVTTKVYKAISGEQTSETCSCDAGN